MALQKKSTLFELAHKPGNSSPQYDIVIVHPFYSKTQRTGVFKNTFDELQARLAKHPVICDVANIYIFSFKGKSIIRGNIKVEAVSNELITRLGEQRPVLQLGSHNHAQTRPEETDMVQSIHTSDYQHRRDGKKAEQDVSQPHLLFISHSLGAWVVKDALLQNNKPNISIFKTQGAVLLDGPPTEHLSVEYILSLSRLFSSRKMKGLGDIFGSSRELVRKLKAIDKRYNVWVDSVYVQEERRKDQMKEDILSDHYDLWLAKHTTDMAGQIPPETKLTAVFRNLTRIITTNQSYDAQLYRVAVQELENLKLENVVAIWINQTNALRPGSTVLSANSEVLESNVHETVQSHSSSQIRPSTPSSWTPGWFAKKRQSTFSSDTTFKSDSDKASIGSAPNIPILQLDDPVLLQIINMGKSFIKRGELDNAEIAFQRASAILHPRSRIYDMRVSSPEVDAQLACISLYRGKYAEAHRKFEALLDCPIPQEQLKNKYNAEISRWIGVALLHQGKYESAMVQFQQLLLQSPRYSSDEEVQIRRDLALASAYSGNFDEAFGQLKMANECLQILEERQALEQKNSMENTTTGREATSTQAVHPTVTPRPIKSNDKEDTSSVDMPLRTPKTSELKAKKDGLLFIQAKIALAWGSFDLALADSELALRGMKKRLGPGHLKTLECASLNALLLALNSQTRAAETACIATHEAMTTELGLEHPYTLEAMGHLVQIYQMQSRFLEAVDTANSLAKIVNSVPTETRPQILHSRCIRAKSELKMGNYATAELELGDVTKVAQTSFKDNRLENLHYQSTLALAYNHCAKNGQAEDLAGRVLRKQLKIYTTRHGHGERGFNEEKVAEEDMTSQIAMIINIASLEQLHSIIEKLIDQGFILTLRPPVLETLWVIALILQQKEDPAALELAIRLLQALWDRFVQGGQVESQDALRVRYDLGLAIRRKAEAEISDENGDKRLGESAEHLRNVYRSRSQVLGHENPETLSARLELIITNCTLGRWEEMLSLAEVSEREKLEKSPEQVDFFSSSSLDQKGWTLVQSESRKIADLHEAKLGENHPETLKSLLWVLAVQALLGDIATATKTSEKILRRLKMVRTQRLVESIHLERKLALVVAVFDRHWADTILRGTRETIQEKRDFMPETWQMLDKMINGELSRLEHMSR